MAETIKACRVCGTSYEGCRTANSEGVFRWQEVACSPECGTVYLKRVIDSRNATASPKPSKPKTTTAKHTARLPDGNGAESEPSDPTDLGK